jgi:ABC-type dipeptide/oligopeptide/nickel transport system permease component
VKRWLIGGWRPVSDTESGRASLVLPAITLGLYQMTLIMRLVRAEMLEVLRTDYIKFARARGLGNRAVHFGHALKNTMVPVITITGCSLARSSPLRSSPKRCSSGRVSAPCSSTRSALSMCQ